MKLVFLNQEEVGASIPTDRILHSVNDPNREKDKYLKKVRTIVNKKNGKLLFLFCKICTYFNIKH